MKICGLLVALLTLMTSSVYPVSAQETKVKWFGHAAFSITTPKGKVLLIDPWLGNPSNPEAKDGKDPLASVPKVDYILLTHGHRDHMGDAVEIAKRTGAGLCCKDYFEARKRCAYVSLCNKLEEAFNKPSLAHRITSV